MNIAIIGSGYVGLITGLCLASKGNNVRCIDINNEIIEKLNKGVASFYEKGLKSLLKQELKSKRFIALNSLERVEIDLDIIIIAVGTPSSENGEINLKYIFKAAKDIAKYIKQIKN